LQIGLPCIQSFTQTNQKLFPKQDQYLDNPL
jgi:hypothetical protein